MGTYSCISVSVYEHVSAQLCRYVRVCVTAHVSVCG